MKFLHRVFAERLHASETELHTCRTREEFNQLPFLTALRFNQPLTHALEQSSRVQNVSAVHVLDKRLYNLRFFRLRRPRAERSRATARRPERPLAPKGQGRCAPHVWWSTVKVCPGLWQGEPAANGNCSTARWGGKEAHGKPATRGTRTALGRRAGASPPRWAKPNSCLDGVQVDAAGVRGRSPRLPGETSRCDLKAPHVSGRLRAYRLQQWGVNATTGVSRGRSSDRVVLS